MSPEQNLNINLSFRSFFFYYFYKQKFPYGIEWAGSRKEFRGVGTWLLIKYFWNSKEFYSVQMDWISVWTSEAHQIEVWFSLWRVRAVKTEKYQGTLVIIFFLPTVSHRKLTTSGGGAVYNGLAPVSIEGFSPVSCGLVFISTTYRYSWT